MKGLDEDITSIWNDKIQRKFDKEVRFALSQQLLELENKTFNKIAQVDQSIQKMIKISGRIVQ